VEGSFCAVPGIAFSPLFDTLAILRTAEVVLVVRLLCPAALTFGFALSATGNCRAVALMMQIASIRQIELLAMLALPPPRTLHRQTHEFELPLLQAPLPKTKKISAATEENETWQNKIKKSSGLNLWRKSCLPVSGFKPLSLPEY
jgi:hypothetical protein